MKKISLSSLKTLLQPKPIVVVETAEEVIEEEIVEITPTEEPHVVKALTLNAEAEVVTVEASSVETTMASLMSQTEVEEKNQEVVVETSKIKEVETETVEQEVVIVVAMIKPKETNKNTRKIILKKLIKNQNTVRTPKRVKHLPLITFRTLQNEQILSSFNLTPALR
jgi:ribosomal protein S12